MQQLQQDYPTHCPKAYCCKTLSYAELVNNVVGKIAICLNRAFFFSFFFFSAFCRRPKAAGVQQPPGWPAEGGAARDAANSQQGLCVLCRHLIQKTQPRHVLHAHPEVGPKRNRLRQRPLRRVGCELRRWLHPRMSLLLRG
jgi:hypothetical protein